MIAATDEAVKKINFFHNLSDEEIAKVLGIGEERKFEVGDLCQTEGQSSNCMYLILEGRIGTVIHIPNVTYLSSEIIMDTLREGDAFGWSSLMKGTPWSTLRVLEPTRTLCLKADELLELCEKDNHIGFILMKNLASLISGRLRRNRVTTLNTILAMKGDG